MNIFTVIANWNGGEHNLACLASLVAQDVPQERIVFVDNGSADGSLELVLEHYPKLVVIRNETNRGFGAAANQGALAALQARAEAVFFLNNDVVLPVGLFDGLAAYLIAHPSVGIVGPRVLYQDDPFKVWCAGGSLNWRQNLSTLMGHGEPDGPEWQTDAAVDYIPGCSMLVRAEVLERVGLFDDAFFAYMEDVDLCLRAARSGFGVGRVGELHALHGPSQATGGGYNPRRKYMMGVNSVHFLKRWGDLNAWLRFVVFDVLSLPVLWLMGLRNGRAKAVQAKAIGIWHGLLGRRVTGELLEPGKGPLW